MWFYKSVHRLCLGLLLTAPIVIASSANAQILSDILDYKLVGANRSVQFLYDDSQPHPEQTQVRDPIVTVVNPGLAAPREVWFMRPGEGLDGNPADLSGISDIVAVVPVAGNGLELHFWSDDPTDTAAQFRARYGLVGAPAAVLQENGNGHDVNNILFGGFASPFEHIIAASDVLAGGLVPGAGSDGGGGGGIAISETYVFRGPTGMILNQGSDGSAMWDAAGFPESFTNVFQITIANAAGLQTTTIGFTEGADPTITDTVTMTVNGNTLTFGAWSEDPNSPHPPVNGGVFDELQNHPPLTALFGIPNGVTGVDGNGNLVTLTQIDFKSDPPVPEPDGLALSGIGGIGVGALLLFRKRRALRPA